MQPLTTGQVDEFFDRGYIVIRGLFSSEEAAQMADAFDRLLAIARQLDEPAERDGSFFKIQYAEAADGQVRKRVHLVSWCGAAAPRLLEFGADPRLLAIASQLLGSREMNQLTNQAHFKEPGDEIMFPLHQDSTHRGYGTDAWEDVNGRGSFVQITTLVDPMTADNGPMVFIPGSCRLGHLGLAYSDTEWPTHPDVDPATEEPLLGDPGDVVAFGPYTLHGSRANRSSSMRRVFINGYAYPGANRREYRGEGAGRLLRLEDGNSGRKTGET